ncbi:MAG TPA: alpha/beta hydrolase [Chitinophagaceae bacterium]|jgi:pimeloyl-ACP methyl ester carboxylesterase|nr:alpha/beta hydrolase [Chitinophagaceae bacterium]
MRQLFRPVVLLFLLVSCKGNDKKEDVEIISNGVKIAYSKCGEGDSTLLFVHGWCISKEYWEPQLAYFCPRYTVVAIDLPGFGRSGTNRSDWSFDAYAEDVKNIIDQLKLKNVILIGHSMSGDILLKVSNLYPALVKGIVGIDNLHEPGSPLTAEQVKDNEGFFAMLSGGFDSTVSKYMTKNLFHSSTGTAIVNRVMNNVFTADSAIAIKVLQALVEASQNEKPLMQGLSHRLYLVNSDIKPVKTDSLAKYCVKGFHVELVPATGHYPMVEKPVLFNTALQKVIDSIGRK